jgi:hypothetical protein
MNKPSENVKTVEEQRAEIFLEIYGVSRMGDVLKNFTKDYNSCKNVSAKKAQSLYQSYSYAIFFMYSPSSIRNNLVKFKNVILENGGKHQAVALQSFTIESVYAPIKRKDVERKRELKKALRSNVSASADVESVEIIKGKIKELQRILEERDYLIRGNQTEEQVRAYYILALLGLATGRRFTEILKTLHVINRLGFGFFSGLLKGNDEKIEACIISLSIKDVQSYIREIRRFVKTGDMTEAEVSAKYAKVFNNALKRLGFKNVKELRHSYSVAGSHIFRRENETTEDTITRILGHKEVFSSALNYT